MSSFRSFLTNLTSHTLPSFRDLFGKMISFSGSENGELTSPLKDVSVSGLTLEILKNVDGLTKDAKLASPGFCGKGQTVPVGDGGPLMRIKEALVG